nr:MAG TPA: hypothetical protein [Caudoviricetes sp.]
MCLIYKFICLQRLKANKNINFLMKLFAYNK